MTAAIHRLGRTLRPSRIEALLAGGGLALLALAAVLMVPLVADRGGPSLLPAKGKPVSVALAEFIPAHHTFADRVQATLELAVDPKRVDVETVRPLVALEPYRVLESSRSVRRAGGTSLVRYRLVLECLEKECLAGILGRRDIAFPATKVFYAGKQGNVRHVDAEWPALRALTRVTPSDLASFPIAVDAEPLTGGGRYRHSPATLAWAASALAALLVVGAAALLAHPFLRRRRRPLAAALVDEPEPDRVTRALAALEATIAPAPADERAPALDRLARELDAVGDHELAKDARRLAWRDDEISPERVEELLAACRKRAVAR
jgi:hypothetical protein